MPKAAPFEAHHLRYEAWFGEYEAACISELLAQRPFVPWEGYGLEIGVGSGRFAGPLGVRVGVDPSGAMLAYAPRAASRSWRVRRKVCLSQPIPLTMPWW